MRLHVEPRDGLVDQPVRWWVEEVAERTPVDLELRCTDAAGRVWTSMGTYLASGDGALVLDDPDQVWTGMQLADRDSAPPTMFTPAMPGWTAVATASVPAGSAQTEVRRVYARDVNETGRSGPGWLLRLFLPRNRELPAPGVLLVGGSTGMAAVAPTAGLLASHGYPTAVLGYMQETGLPMAMDRIPTEVVGAALQSFSEAGPVVVWALSVGTGLALTALAEPTTPPVAGVIAAAPTDVVWQAVADGGPPPRRSSLSRGGEDLPYVPMRSELLLGQMAKNAVLRRLPGRPRSTALRLYEAYARALKKTAAVDRAAIPVERIDAPLLLIAGDADVMWPAAQMATNIRDRRRQAGVGADDELLVLPGAGHFLRPPATPTTVDRNLGLISGGTPVGNAHGQRNAWSTAMAFLARTLGPAQ